MAKTYDMATPIIPKIFPSIKIPIIFVESNIIIPIDTNFDFSAARNFDAKIVFMVIGIREKLKIWMMLTT